MRGQVHDGDKLALVIPTLREVACLPRLLEQARAVLGELGLPFEIIVVDDDSRDGTAELVRQIGRQDARVRLLVRRRERGLSGAILHGWQNTEATILAAMDADMQHPPDLLRELLAEIVAGSDVAIASRCVRRGSMPAFHPIRRLASAVAIGLSRPLQQPGHRVRDPLSGYFLVRRRCVENLLFRPTGFKLLLEILVRGRVRSVTEVPFAFGRRAAGRSKAGFRAAWEYLQLLGRLYIARWKELRMAPRIQAD